MPSGHRLVTWDYSSMFTNIPLDMAKSIIRQYYYLIEIETNVPVKLFIDVLTFLVDEVAYFTYKDGIFRQNKGLAMGNRLSQLLAEIVTSVSILEAKKKIEENKISFLFKFVDDLGGAIDADTIPIFEDLLNNAISGLSVKREDEDENKSVSYLNCKMNRREDNSIGFIWWQKSYSSRQIMNFHSNHPYYVKRNVVREYISNAIRITTDEHLSEAVCELMKTLKRSSYPENFIMPLIFQTIKSLKSSDFSSTFGSPDCSFDCEKELSVRRLGRLGLFNEMEQNELKKKQVIKRKVKRLDRPEQKRYVTMPFNRLLFMNSNEMIKKFNIRSSLAPKPALQNGRVIFSKVKDRRGNSNVKFGLFAVRCKDCSFEKWFRTTNLDVERTLKFEFNRKNSTIIGHMNTGHTIPFSVFSLKSFKNNYDLRIAFELKMKDEFK